MRRATARTLHHDDQGLSLVELLVALTILAIVMPALAATTFSTLRATQVNDQRTVATNLAQAEIEAVQSTMFADLTSTLGRTTRTVQNAGTTYVVARDTTLTGLGAAVDPCSAAGGTPETALARVDVEVWPQGQPERIGRSSTTVARPAGDVVDPTRGALAIRVSDHRDPPQGVPSVVVTVSRTSPSSLTRQQATGATGCVVFTNLPAGTYTIQATKSGHVGRTVGAGDTLTVSGSVIANDMQVYPDLRLAPAATANLVAAPKFDVGAVVPASMPISLQRDGVTIRGTAGSPLASLWPGTWDLWAGDCRSADPLTWSPAAGRQAPAILAPGNNTVTAALGVTTLEVTASEETPLRLPLQVTATTSDCGADGTPTYTIPDLGPSGATTTTPPELRIALPYGEWNLDVRDADGQVAELATVTLPPTAEAPVPALRIPREVGG